MGLMEEYILKGIDAKDYEDELLRLIKEYNKYKKTFLLVYTVAFNKRIPDIILQQEDYFVIMDMLRGMKLNELDFYLETPGGSGETAEEIVRHLRKVSKKISFLVAGEAKSAGTIMVLSADEILMTDIGSLGPIDAKLK